MEADGGYVEYVAKWFKFEADKQEWYFAEAEAQMVSERLAQQVRKLLYRSTHPSRALHAH